MECKFIIPESHDEPRLYLNDFLSSFDDTDASLLSKERLRVNLLGFGCTTLCGNDGDINPPPNAASTLRLELEVGS